MSNVTRESMLALIRRNIEEHGFHIYVVSGGGAIPRFAYTIGLRESLGRELVMAGAYWYSSAEARKIIHGIRRQLESGASASSSFSVEALGSFGLREAAAPWVQALLLGAMDYYGVREIDAYQVVPDDEHCTLDVPDMTRGIAGEPVWQWLAEPWTYDVPEGATAITNVAALRGARVTEACRWELDQWELFAGEGPEIPEDEMREVPLGTLLAIDPSLVPVTTLEVGSGLWRDDEDENWNVWE